MATRRPRAPIVAVEGISGAGKSTLVARAAAYGWTPLAEAYDRLDPPPDLTVPTPTDLARTERLLLAEEGRRFVAARAIAASGRPVVADTGFLGPLTYTAALVALGAAPPALARRLTATARRRARVGTWGLPDLTVFLDTAPATRARRIDRDPVRHPPALARRHEAVGRIEERFYRGPLARLLPGRVRRVSGEASPTTVAGRFLRLARGAPCADGRRPVDRVLAALDAGLAPVGGGRPLRPSATVKNGTQSGRAPPRR